MPEQVARRRIARIKQRIAAIQLLGSGTLVARTKACGKPNCRCAHDPSARHGPYFEWNRHRRGELQHATVPPDLVPDVRRALANYQLLLELLDRWEQESVRLILGPAALTHGRRRT